MTTATLELKPRMKHPIAVYPEAMRALQAFGKTTRGGAVPLRTLLLVELRASQINGCSVCVDMHSKELKKDGDTDDRIFAVAAWRDNPAFTEAERAALSLAESLTRLADTPDPVTDEVWNEAARHYDEAGLAALLIDIASINAWNRLNAGVRQVVGPWTA